MANHAAALTAHTLTSGTGQERHFSLALAMSALPLTADLKLGIGTGSEGPEGDNPNQPDNRPFANGLA